MPACRRIALFNRRHRRIHKPVEQRLDLRVQLPVFVSHRRLRRERKRQVHRALRKRLHVIRRVRRIANSRRRIRLRIDQLQHAEHFALRVPHRQAQQTLRVIAGLLIEAVVEMKRQVVRNFVRVLEIQHFAAQRRVARHRFFAQRQRHFLERKIQRIILRQLEAQLPVLPVRILFHQIQRTRIRAGDLPRLRQNHVQQQIELALRRERHANFVELFPLPFRRFQRLPRLPLARGRAQCFRKPHVPPIPAPAPEEQPANRGTHDSSHEPAQHSPPSHPARGSPEKDSAQRKAPLQSASRRHPATPRSSRAAAFAATASASAFESRFIARNSYFALSGAAKISASDDSKYQIWGFCGIRSGFYTRSAFACRIRAGADARRSPQYSETSSPSRTPNHPPVA